MAEHRCRARQHADPLTADLQADESRHEPFRDVEQRHGHAEPAAVHAEHVRCPDVAAPMATDVLAAEEPREQQAERNRSDQVPPGNDEGVREHYLGMA